MEQYIMERFEAAMSRATLNDLHTARQLAEYLHRDNPGLNNTEALAVGIRYGIRAGKAGSDKRAKEAYAQLRVYREDKSIGKIPSERVQNAAAAIDDPAELRALAALLEARAAALEALPPIADIDVNSDGNMEVLIDGRE